MTEEQALSLSNYFRPEQFQLLSCPSDELREVYNDHQIRQLAILFLASDEMKFLMQLVLHVNHLKKYGGSIHTPYENFRSQQ